MESKTKRLYSFAIWVLLGDIGEINMTVITKLILIFAILNTADCALTLIGLQLGHAQELNPTGITVTSTIMKLIVLPTILIFWIQKSIKHPELVIPITLSLYVLVVIFGFVVFNNTVVVLREIYTG